MASDEDSNRGDKSVGCHASQEDWSRELQTKRLHWQTYPDKPQHVGRRTHERYVGMSTIYIK
jgi:hypothetical protein